MPLYTILGQRPTEQNVLKLLDTALGLMLDMDGRNYQASATVPWSLDFTSVLTLSECFPKKQ